MSEAIRVCRFLKELPFQANGRSKGVCRTVVRAPENQLRVAFPARLLGSIAAWLPGSTASCVRDQLAVEAPCRVDSR